MKPHFSGFDDVADIASQFDVSVDTVYDYNLIVAIYETGCYEGDAFLLMEKDGKLFEVHGSHCSCYELEGQFDVEETTKESLMHRITTGEHYSAFGTAAPIIKQYFEEDDSHE